MAGGGAVVTVQAKETENKKHFLSTRNAQSIVVGGLPTYPHVTEEETGAQGG